MRVLILDSALGRCAAAIVTDGTVVASRVEDRRQRHEELLPMMAQAVLAEASGPITLIGVTIGPGSFTGIRAGLALAHGIGLAAGVPVIGVTVGEAIARALPDLGARTLWTAAPSRTVTLHAMSIRGSRGRSSWGALARSTATSIGWSNSMPIELPLLHATVPRIPSL